MALTINEIFATDKDLDSFFQLNQSFVNSLQSMTNIDLGKLVPYISLKTMDINGKVVENLNLQFFKAVDMQNITTQDTRYKDRPVASLKSVEIKTDLASGYLYYTLVNLDIKIHSPQALVDQGRTIINLLIPKMPIILEYGWNSDDPNNFLNEKQTLLFNVKCYDIKIDQTGQIDLTIEGIAFNEMFGSILIGDEAFNQPLSQLASGYPITQGTGNIQDIYEKIQDYCNYNINLLTNNGKVDYSVVKNQAEPYNKLADRATGIIAQTFQKKLDQCRQISAAINAQTVPQIKTKSIKFGDLFSNMCYKTIENSSNTMLGATAFKVVWGLFNENCGSQYANNNIDDFELDWDIINKNIGKNVEKGRKVLTVQAFLNLITDLFLNNENYWQSKLSSTEAANFTMPYIVFNFRNYKDVNNNNAQTIELQILDINRKVPPTTSLFPTSGTGPANAVETALQQANSTIPIIRLGHASSFIKRTSLSQVTDEYIKAALISRIYSDSVDINGNLPASLQSQAQFTAPLQLPLRGTMDVIGCVKWQPFKAFYLDAGIYMINAIYKITSVTHRLSYEGFSTSLEFLYH